MLGNVDGAGQKYGDSRSGGRVHVGYDIGTGGVAGRLVVAGSAGTVTAVDDRASATARGKYVLISHEGGVRTLYQHLASTSVAVGQQVTTGQIIGVCGDTGTADYAIHLHLEVFTSGASNSIAASETVDPKQFFAARGVALGKSTPTTDPGTPPTTPNDPTEDDDMLHTVVVCDAGNANTSVEYGSTAIIDAINGWRKLSHGLGPREELQSALMTAGVLGFPVVEKHVDFTGWLMVKQHYERV